MFYGIPAFFKNIIFANLLGGKPTGLGVFYFFLYFPCQIPVTLLKKSLWHRCFQVKFAKLSRTPFLQNISGGYFYHMEFLHPKSQDSDITWLLCFKQRCPLSNANKWWYSWISYLTGIYFLVKIRESDDFRKNRNRQHISTSIVNWIPR